MLDEEVEESRLVLFELGEFLDDRVGDEVGAPRFGGERELRLEPVGRGLALDVLHCIGWWL